MLTLTQAREYARLEMLRMGRDFQYNELHSPSGCFYVPSTDPRTAHIRAERGCKPAKNSHLTGCFVGSIIARAGLMTDAIASESASVYSLVEKDLLKVETPRVTQYLSDLQTAQDDGHTWGRAYDKAEACFQES